MVIGLYACFAEWLGIDALKYLTYVCEMSERDPDARRAAIVILRSGLMTVPEVAAHAGVSRQLVRYWCKRARVNFSKVRSARLAKLWARVITS